MGTQKTSLVAQVITLPWPPKGLSPNDRLHHYAIAALKKKYREACSLKCIVDGLKPMQGVEKALVHIVFFPPRKGRRDIDNCLASIKSGLDGVADVLGLDDSRWHISMEMAPVVGGMVRLSIRPWDERIAALIAELHGVVLGVDMETGEIR